MRKTTINLILAAVSAVYLCACLCITPLSPEAVPYNSEQVYTAPIAVAPANDETETVQTVEEKS